MSRTPKIFAFWLGGNPMSDARRSACRSLSNSGLDVVFLTRETLPQYIDSRRLHPAFDYLNLAHQADYLRAYLMHTYGGGYSDIKWVDRSWLPAVSKVEASDKIWAAGYQEVSAATISNIDFFPAGWSTTRLERWRLQLEKRWYKHRYERLMATNAFYFKPHTPLTNLWWSEVNRRLDFLAPALAENPARQAKEKPGDIVDGEPSRYPVPWTFILGSVLHPLSYRFRNHIVHDIPMPVFDHAKFGNYSGQDMMLRS